MPGGVHVKWPMRGRPSRRFVRCKTCQCSRPAQDVLGPNDILPPTMILAGIDEAGYGPLLGPLVVGCCAFELTDGDPAADELPCLWKRLRKLVSKNRTKA